MPGSGSDSANGDAGTDTLSYADATSGATINLATSLATDPASDSVPGFENVIGVYPFPDTLVGTVGNNTLNGGSGVDTVSYAQAPNGVSVESGADRPPVGGQTGWSPSRTSRVLRSLTP